MSKTSISSFVSVKFDHVGRLHHFLLPEVGFEEPIKSEETVVVLHSGRQTYGTVKRSIRESGERHLRKKKSADELIRRATKNDITVRLKQQQFEKQAREFGSMKIREFCLPMKLIRVEQQHDKSRLVFFFTSEERIDFRELVRELSSKFRCRIEMRHIGARDEAKILGGYGTCGRPLCCTTWLNKFEPISIKMAKRQNLSLSPSKLSGLCGRLKCSLRYELPNAAGEQFGGCANEGSCSRSAIGESCSSGGCGTGGNCSSCGL